MSKTTFPDFYQQRKERVDRALERWLPAEDAPSKLLNEAMRYSVFNGGKRLRGVLVLEAGTLGEDPGPEVLDALSAVIEMIHAYSLVHDDLPAMDDDDFRRGEPSNHKQFGEDIAVLAGDGLLTRAFEVLGRLPELGLDDSLAIKIIQETGKESGGLGLIGGQVADLRIDTESAEIEDVETIHHRKTGALMSLSLRMGGIASGLDEASLDALGTFGRSLGLAFQIKDDLLEISGDLDTLGKDPDSDEDGEKLTYPALLGIEESEEALVDTINRAREHLSTLDADRTNLEEIIQLVVDRNH